MLNESICQNDVLTLQGNIPSPIIGPAEWSQISGPSVIIDSPNSPITTVSGYVGGNTYIFRYSAVCGDGVEAFQDKTVVVEPITIADAGINVSSCPDTSGGIVVSGNTPQNSGEIGHWEIVSSNDAGLTIDLPNSSVTTLDLPATSCGTTTIAWIIEGPEFAPGEFCSSTSEIEITNYGGENPISAGNDVNLGNCYTTTQSTSLNASYGGCGLNGQSGNWEFVSGPNIPTIANPGSNSTNVSNLEEGSYVFRWTVTGPCASGSDEVVVNVPAATQDVTTLGGDENIFLCDTSVTQITLTGDSPSFSGETVEWTQVGGGTLPPGSIQTPNNPSTLITNLNDGDDPYVFRYTLENTNTGCSFSKDYTVEYKQTTRTITANEGNNIFGECNQTNFTIPLETTGTGSNKYKILSGPVSSPLGPFPTGIMNVGNELNIDLTVGGIYVINFARVENGSLPVGCSNGFDSITVFVSDAATLSNAGSDVNLPCGDTSAPLAGVSTSSGGHVWSQLSGPNQATIVSPFQQNTTATGLISGSYVFQYITKGAGTKCPLSIDTVQVNVSSSSVTASDAGSDQTICVDAPVNLSANNPQAGEFGEWTQVSGPTTITFSNTNDPNATAIGFSQASSNYVLRWTIDYIYKGPSGCSLPAQDDITITTNNNNSPTVADAGTDQCLPSGTTTVNLSGNASTLIETGTWMVTPSTGVSFININDPNTTATVPSDGEYLFTWTITRNIAAGCTTPTSDDVLITIANDATADAGPDQTICGDEVTMNASLSSGSTGTWSLVSGLGGYTFDDINDPNSTVHFLYSGVYIFEWLVESGDCSTSSDEVRIIVGIPPTTADANIDQEVCNATSVTLNANSYNSNIETGKWSVVSGAPNTPEIADTTNPNTAISNLVSGTYTFRWTITSKGNPLCPPSFDEMQVEVWTPATAGEDQTYCDVENVQLVGNENSTGTWTQTAGSTTGVTITQSPSNNYIANATVVAGNTYEFTYTTDSFNFTSGNTCASTSDAVEITVNSGASINPDAGPDQIICTDDVGGVITLDGNPPPSDVDTAEWKILYEPSGSNANINSVNSENTQVSGLNVPGLYVFEWVFSSDSCRDLSDVVRVRVYEAPSTANAGPDDNVACQLTYQTNAVAPSAGIGTWSFATTGDDPSGGDVIIDNPNNPQTTLSNITALGTYILTWTVTNGPFTNPSLCEPSIDTVSITFNDDPPSNADAGPDQELCDETQTTLAAVPLSDGLGTWMQTSGPNTANIASPNDENTAVFGLISGVYEFTWIATTINDDGCSSQDTMQIEVFDEPSIADAGPNQVLSEFSPVILAGNTPTIGEGEWNQLSGPTTVAFTDETDPTTQVSGTTTGIYTFQWEISNGNCISDTDVVIIEIKSISDLELTKTVSSSSVNVGDVVTFSIDVFNNDAEAGGTDATGVSVKDEIPDGFTLVPGSVSNNGVYNIGDLSITWSNLNILNGNSITLTFDAVVNSTGSYTNTAQIIESDQVDLDSTPNNDDGDQSEDDEDSATVTIQQADLSLTKTVSPSLVSIGDAVVFTLEVINAGPDDASNISVSDQLPSGYTYQSDNGGGTYDSSTGNWTINNLANGNSVSLTITATVNSSGDYFNIAEIIEVDQTDPDSTPDNDDGDQSEDDEDNASVTLETVDLELSKKVSPVSGTTGDQVTFTLTVDNLGSGNATGVSIEDYLPSGYSLVPGSVSNSGIYDTASSTILWSNLTIGSGSTLSITFDAIINSTGNYLNTTQIISSDLLDVDSTPDNDDGDQSEDDEDSALVTFISPSVDLSLTKIVVDGDTSPVIGTEVTFEITITNSSSINATGVEVTDLLPDGYDFVLFSSSAGTYDENTGIWNVGTVAATSSETLLIDVLVEPSGNYTNIAEVSTSNVADPDSSPGNGDASEDDYDSASTTPIPPSADLELSKSVVGGNTTPLIGSQITFELSVSNAGPQAATGVLVEDILPSGYSYLLSSATLGSYDQTTGIWNVGAVGSGVTETLQLTVTVNASGNYTNIAEVSASDVSDPDSSPSNGDASEDNYASASTSPIPPSADLELSKSVVGGNTTPAIGSQITFEIVIENNGPQDATGVIVNDLLPNGYSFVLANYTTGNYSNTTGDWTIGTIASGSIETLQLTVTVNASGNYTNIAEVSASDVADPDSTPNNDDGDQSEDDEDSVTINIQYVDLSINKSVDDVNANVGDAVTFTIQLENNGVVAATGVAVQDIIPLGYGNISTISNGGVFDGENINWTNLTVPLSGLTISYQAIVNRPILMENEYLNIVQVTECDQYDLDSTPNNDDGDQSEDDEDSAFINIPETDIAIVKEVDNNKPAMDALVNFTITASNIGSLDASSVEVFDLLPSGYELNSVNTSSGTYDDSSGIWFIPSIASGSSENMTITAKVIDVSDYVNIASLISLDQLDINDDNNEAKIAVEPTCLKIYNQFSPNDDGSNETFYIDCITNYPNNVLEIYNRWGDLVFKQIYYDNTWKGTSNGPEKTLPVGTYFYVLDLGDGSEKVSGWLYLKR